MSSEAMKKSEGQPKINRGLIAFTLGILSIAFSNSPVLGIVMGIVGIYFARVQHKQGMTEFSRLGNILSIIGIIVSALLLIALGIMFLTNPEFLAQVQAVGAQ